MTAPEEKNDEALLKADPTPDPTPDPGTDPLTENQIREESGTLNWEYCGPWDEELE